MLCHDMDLSFQSFEYPSAEEFPFKFKAPIHGPIAFIQITLALGIAKCKPQAC